MKLRLFTSAMAFMAAMNMMAADHVIDLGPEGGKEGGEVVCAGTPEEVAQCEKSYTGKYLKKILEKS